MRKTLLAGFLFVFIAGYSFAKEYKVGSPDGKIQLAVNVDSDIRWSASLDGKELINCTGVSMILADGKVLGANEKVKRTKKRLSASTLETPRQLLTMQLAKT